MDGDLTPEQITHVYDLLTGSGISYLSVSEQGSLRAVPRQGLVDQ